MTLIEIMVAMTISLILLAGVLQIFISSKNTYRMSEGSSRLQESGRFAISLMSNSIRMAGYTGCNKSTTQYNHLKSNTVLDYRFNIALEGYEAANTEPGKTVTLAAGDMSPGTSASSWAPSLDSVLLAANKALPKSDILVVRSYSAASAPVISLADHSGLKTTVSKIDLDQRLGEVKAHDILAVSDCVKSSIFQASNVDGSTEVTIKHAASGNPGNETTTWDVIETYNLAELHRVETLVYYVGEGTNGPALFRANLILHSGDNMKLDFSNNTELLPGVENMQLLYGVDTDGNDNIDTYRTASEVTSANQWDQVLSVQIALLVRSENEVDTVTDNTTYQLLGTIVDPINDRRLRQVFSSTIAVRNRVP